MSQLVPLKISWSLKASMLTKTDKYKKRSYMKNCKNYGGFGTKELLKIENDDGKTDL